MNDSGAAVAVCLQAPRAAALLAASGWQVEQPAPDTAAAAVLLLHPDLIICGTTESVARLTVPARSAGIPLLALVEPAARVAALRAGADAYALLPLDGDELLPACGRLLAARRQMRDWHAATAELTELRARVQRYLPAGSDGILAAEQRTALPTARRAMGIFYSDIRGFTRLSEQMPPERVIDLLNFILYFIFDVILRHGGGIDKVIGDAILAVFDDADGAAAVRAVAAAQAVQREMQQCNEILAASPRFNPDGDLQPVWLGIGVNYAEVVQGNLGTPDRMDYTVIGDGVNMASRCQSQARGGEIIVTETVAERVRAQVALKPLAPVDVKGKSGKQQLFLVPWEEAG